MCYCFDDIVELEDFDFYILIDEKPHENTSNYGVSYKISIDWRPLHTTFDKIDRLIRVYYGTRYLVLLGPEKYNAIYKRI